MLAHTTRKAAIRTTPIIVQQQRSISHIEKSQRLGRPVSPHVTIYAFPLAALTSVTHRLTGGMLTIGMYGVGLGSLAGVDVTHVMAAIGQSSIGPLAKFTVAFPIAFHAIGGVRHMYWEHYPANLSPETQRQASIAVVASSVAVSAIAAVL